MAHPVLLGSVLRMKTKLAMLLAVAALAVTSGVSAAGPQFSPQDPGGGGTCSYKNYGEVYPGSLAGTWCHDGTGSGWYRPAWMN